MKLLLLLALTSKTCPGELTANMHTFGNFDLGAEIMGVGYFLPDGSLLPINSNATSFFTGKLNFAAGYSISDWGYAYVELGARRKFPSRTPYECPLALRGIKVRVRELYFEAMGDNFDVKVGRQNLVIGSQMVMDDRFDALWMNYGRIDVFAGTIAADVARGASFCPDELIRAYTYCYKDICGSKPGENSVAGAGIHFDPVSFYFLRQFNMTNSDYEGNILDVFANFSIARFRIGTEIAYHTDRKLGYYHVYVQRRINLPSDIIGQFWIGGLGNSLSATQLEDYPIDSNLNPVFGSVWLGDRYRFEAGAGHVMYLKTSLARGNVRLETTAAYELVSGSNEVELILSYKPVNRVKLRFGFDVVDTQNKLAFTEIRIYP